MNIRRDLRIPRERMVQQLYDKGIKTPAVLHAISKVPRHLFLPEALEALAYVDTPQPIGYGQTISQPYVVACMTELLQVKKAMTVLEIGTGSGYQTAILSALGLEIFTVERIRELYFNSKKLFMDLALKNIRTKLDDGTLGWPEAAPFDRIIVTAGGNSVPEPLLKQLADPGIMVIPIGNSKSDQRLVVIEKKMGKITQTDSKPAFFVDLIGEYGKQA